MNAAELARATQGCAAFIPNITTKGQAFEFARGMLTSVLGAEDFSRLKGRLHTDGEVTLRAALLSAAYAVQLAEYRQFSALILQAVERLARHADGSFVVHLEDGILLSKVDLPRECAALYLDGNLVNALEQAERAQLRN